MLRKSIFLIIPSCFVLIAVLGSLSCGAADRLEGGGTVGALTSGRGQTQKLQDWGPLKNWETEVMGVRVKGNAQRKNNEIRGVLHIYPPLSHKWTYHWNGRIDGDSVVASHTDGHVFRGSITPDKTVVGTLTTKDGMKIPLQAPLP